MLALLSTAFWFVRTYFELTTLGVQVNSCRLVRLQPKLYFKFAKSTYPLRVCFFPSLSDAEKISGLTVTLGTGLTSSFSSVNFPGVRVPDPSSLISNIRRAMRCPIALPTCKFTDNSPAFVFNSLTNWNAMNTFEMTISNKWCWLVGHLLIWSIIAKGVCMSNHRLHPQSV